MLEETNYGMVINVLTFTLENQQMAAIQALENS